MMPISIIVQTSSSDASLPTPNSAYPNAHGAIAIAIDVARVNLQPSSAVDS
jgi:hypothetical protein